MKVFGLTGTKLETIDVVYVFYDIKGEQGFGNQTMLVNCRFKAP